MQDLQNQQAQKLQCRNMKRKEISRMTCDVRKQKGKITNIK